MRNTTKTKPVAIHTEAQTTVPAARQTVTFTLDAKDDAELIFLLKEPAGAVRFIGQLMIDVNQYNKRNTAEYPFHGQLDYFAISDLFSGLCNALDIQLTKLRNL